MDDKSPWTDADMAYLSAVYPTAVLELLDEIERLRNELADRNGIITRLKHELMQGIPLLENCGRYYAQDNAGQWHYLNHARTWQTYFFPMAKDKAE